MNKYTLQIDLQLLLGLAIGVLTYKINENRIKENILH